VPFALPSTSVRALTWPVWARADRREPIACADCGAARARSRRCQARGQVRALRVALAPIPLFAALTGRSGRRLAAYGPRRSACSLGP